MKTNVTFPSSGLSLAGQLYVPDGRAGSRRPAIVVSHPASGVKEQAAGLYAERLANKGFVALAFDAAYQGESEGEPRGLEDPAQRVEDIKAAVSFLSVHGAVDAERIGVLGICASGGYVVPASATDHRVKAVATVSAADLGRQFREGGDGQQDPKVIEAMLDQAAAARTAEALGDSMGTFPIFPAGEEAARAGLETSNGHSSSLGRHIFEGWEYYCTDRGYHPRSAKFFTLNSLDRIAHFDAFRFISSIAPRPLLMIVGREAVTSFMTSEAFWNAQEPKEIFWIDGATHVALYDEEEYVAPAIARLIEFFSTHLTEQNNATAPTVVSAIVGTRDGDPVDEALAGSAIRLDDEVMQRIDDLMVDAVPVAGPSPEGM
jgi:fermentation-respiration switch protein FrsA (DUF1100 family)